MFPNVSAIGSAIGSANFGPITARYSASASSSFGLTFGSFTAAEMAPSAIYRVRRGDGTIRRSITAAEVFPFDDRCILGCPADTDCWEPLLVNHVNLKLAPGEQVRMDFQNDGPFKSAIIATN